MWGQVIFSRGEPRLRWLSGRASRLLPLPHGPRHARRRQAGPQGRSPKLLPLNFHATRPDTSGLKEQSPNGVSDMPGGREVVGVGSRSSHLGRLVRRAGLPGPSPPGAEHATPRLPRRPLLPPHAPFKREAQLDLCRPRRDSPYGGAIAAALDSRGSRASRAEGRASGRRPPSPQRGRGSAARAATGAEEGRARPDWGRGGGERRGAGSPALVRLLTAARWGDVITMARSLCPGAWLREALLPPGRPAASPPRARLCAGLARLPPPSLGRRPPEPRCPLPPGSTWRRALPRADRAPQPPPRRCPAAPQRPDRSGLVLGALHPESPGT